MNRVRTDVKIKPLLCAKESRGAEYLTLVGVAGELFELSRNIDSEVMRGQLHMAKISRAALCESLEEER